MATKKSAGKTKLPKIDKVSSIYKKSELITTLAEHIEVTNKQVKSFLDGLSSIIMGHIKKGAVGRFVFPGMFKVLVKDVPARKARKGTNPFTGEATTFKARPASKKVKIL